MRRMSGIAATLATVALLTFLLVIDAPVLWRLLLILPAAGAASGFLQDAFHFCAAFGLKGIFNVINSMGITDNVDLEEYRVKDRNKALQIIILSVVIGLIVGGLSLLIP